MDDLLNEYIEQEKQLDSSEYEKDENGLRIQHEHDDEQEYLDYIERTKEYYYRMSLGDFFRALWFTASSTYICATEYLKYAIGWKSRNNAIIDVSKRLSSRNMMYVKIFQAFATNRNIVSPELNQFFCEFTDNVKYTEDEYDIDELKEIERRSIECAPYRQLRILNDYRPIKSGLMSLIFKGVLITSSESGSGSEDEEVVIKYLRKNININFTASMNNLVVFAKLTRYFPYLRTLNVESLILQNIVCLKDQVNFRKELANIMLYYRHWHKYEYIKIPKPYPEFTENINPDAIVMEYVHGMKITDIDPEDNDDFGKILASFNAKAAFCTSFYHGDLHPGNILFIKNAPTSTHPTHQICILDFGIIGHLSRYDQELLFIATKYMYQQKFDKIIDIIMSCELSESADMKSDIQNIIPLKHTEKYENLRRELTDVIVRYTTPEIKFFGVSEIYEINYILNNYGLMFKRSLYRLFITVAIMDSIGTRLGSKMSYMQHMTDIVVELFNIDISGNDEEDEDEEDDDEEDEEVEEPDEESEPTE